MKPSLLPRLAALFLAALFLAALILAPAPASRAAEPTPDPGRYFEIVRTVSPG